MKTLKLFVLTSLLVAFAFSTTSCSKKDDDNNSSIDYKKEIVGSWKVVKMVFYKNGEVERTVDLNSDEEELSRSGIGQLFQFFNDGTFLPPVFTIGEVSSSNEEYQYFEGVSIVNGKYVTTEKNFPYEVEGNKLTASYEYIYYMNSGSIEDENHFSFSGSYSSILSGRMSFEGNTLVITTTKEDVEIPDEDLEEDLEDGEYSYVVYYERQ